MLKLPVSTLCFSCVKLKAAWYPWVAVTLTAIVCCSHSLWSLAPRHFCSLNTGQLFMTFSWSQQVPVRCHLFAWFSSDVWFKKFFLNFILQTCWGLQCSDKKWLVKLYFRHLTNIALVCGLNSTLWIVSCTVLKYKILLSYLLACDLEICAFWPTIYSKFTVFTDHGH